MQGWRAWWWMPMTHNCSDLPPVPIPCANRLVAHGSRVRARRARMEVEPIFPQGKVKIGGQLCPLKCYQTISVVCFLNPNQPCPHRVSTKYLLSQLFISFRSLAISSGDQPSFSHCSQVSSIRIWRCSSFRK